MERQFRLGTLDDAVAMIRDGAVLAIGGCADQRVPMALVREIARQGRTGLRVVRLDHAMNLAALDKADCRYVDGDQGVLRARLSAAAAGLAFMPLGPDAAPDVEPASDCAVDVVVDPFTGKTVRVAVALRPDVAIIHAHMGDRYGNVALDANYDPAAAFDATLARASKRVIVSVEQIVSEETLRRSAHGVLLRADEVACVVQTPYGAHPCACDARYEHDLENVAPDAADAADHDAYLQDIGSRRLFALTRRLATRL